MDWTAGYVSTSSSVKLPKIIFNPDHPEFASENTATSLTEARYIARQKAKEIAEIQLMHAVLSLPVDHEYTIQEKMKIDENLADRMGILSRYFIVQKVNTGEGFVSIELAIPFFSEKGLFSIISDSNYGSEKILEYPESKIRQKITGIIIDCTEFSSFRPAVETRIYTDQGKMIYGPEILSSRITVQQGLGGFYPSQILASRDFRAGISPYYLYASSVDRGRIYLDSKEVKRILSSPGGQNALRHGRVLFLTAR